MPAKLVRSLFLLTIAAVAFLGIYLPQQLLHPSPWPQSILWPALTALGAVAILKLLFIPNDDGWSRIDWFTLPWLPTLYVVALEGLLCTAIMAGMVHLAVLVTPAVVEMAWPLLLSIGLVAILFVWAATGVFVQVFALRFPKRKVFQGETIYHPPYR